MNDVRGKFVVATPMRTVCDDNARALEKAERLRFIALGTRRGTAGVPPERTRLNPAIGLTAYVAAKTLPPFAAETLRFGLLPWFDRWVKPQLVPGDHIISSYGYVNDCFRYVRDHGGKTFLDAGNSHPEHYWEIIADEYARWSCPLDPFPRNWFERSKAMMPLVDYVLSPSSYVTRSFLERGFRPEQIIRNVYPLDLSCFHPPSTPRPGNRPLTIISTGMPSLRKGTPYLLEAFRMILRTEPNARLLLTAPAHPSLKYAMKTFADLPIEWGPSLPHPKLAERLRGADVFVLLSLEEGLARTACEALACGLPIVVTPNTGANDLVRPGENGEIVPLSDSAAAAEAILRCWARRQTSSFETDGELLRAFAPEQFSRDFLHQLALIESQKDGWKVPRQGSAS